jgi:hypothetical protein
MKDMFVTSLVLRYSRPIIEERLFMLSNQNHVEVSRASSKDSSNTTVSTVLEEDFHVGK